MLHCVITTIQRPTASVRRLAAQLAGGQGKLVIAGDTKGPDAFSLVVDGFDAAQLSVLRIDDQLAGDFELARALPTRHYCRKNIGYLEAIRAGATCIYETDDDNAPLATWAPRREHLAPLPQVRTTSELFPQWVNVYRCFSEANIWPRGLPLDRIHDAIEVTTDLEHGTRADAAVWAPIQQGLADGAPDVDAIWRLVCDREFSFDPAPSVQLPPGQWCPFNTQSTWWWPVVYPLLYVPSYCSFRMCDIWKSFVAQRCLWELQTGIVFHASEVYQERNAHDLMRDFRDEIPGYDQNNQLAACLEDVSLLPGKTAIDENLRRCYEALVKQGFFPDKELPLVELWLTEVNRLRETQTVASPGRVDTA